MTETTWTETDALYAARNGESLAKVMLRNGAQLVGPAPRTVEQAVTAAEVAAEAEAIVEDVAVIEIGDIPADAPCSHPSCAHADPASPCRCSFCLGLGHGWVVALAQDAARARFDAEVPNPFAIIPAAPADDEPQAVRVARPFNASPIVIDGEVW